MVDPGGNRSAVAVGNGPTRAAVIRARVGPLRRARAAAVVVPLVFLSGCDSGGVGPEPATFEVVEALRLSELAADDFVVEIEFTGDGSLWVGSFAGRVLQVTPGGVVDHTGALPLFGSDRIRDVFVDSADRVWVVAADGYAVFGGGAWADSLLPSRGGIPVGLSQIAVNDAGEILLGTIRADEGGVFTFSDGRWRELTPGNSDLPGFGIQTIEVGPGGEFWVGATGVGGGGLARIAGGRVTLALGGESGLLYPWIDALAVDEGEVWIGYEVPVWDRLGFPDGGLQRLRPGTGQLFDHFPYSAGLSSNRVRAVTLGRDGELWFTTSLDEDQAGCEVCLSSVGRLVPGGGFTILSAFNSGLQPNAFFPDIAMAPEGSIWVANERSLLRVIEE